MPYQVISDSLLKIKTGESTADILKQYIDAGLSVLEISRLLNVQPQSVRKAIKRAGLEK
jgi:hypothetical protein